MSVSGSCVVGAMSAGGVLHGPPEIGVFPIESGTTYASLHRFAWDVRCGKLSFFVVRAVPARDAMAV